MGSSSTGTTVQPGNPIVGGVALRRPAIRSPDYQVGVSGWTINQDGSAEFNNATFRGTVQVVGANGSIKITGTIPAELVTFYAPTTVEGVFQFVHASGAYEYIATLNTDFTAYGAVTSTGTVRQAYELSATVANEALMSFGITSVQIQTDGANGGLIVAGDRINGSFAGVAGGSSPGTTASGTYADLPGGGFAFDFNKRYTGSSIRIDFSQSFVNTVTANNRIDFAVLINGTDYPVVSLNPNVINQHACAAATAYVAAGLTHNSYTIKGRWKRGTGTGTASINTDDWTAIAAEERG